MADEDEERAQALHFTLHLDKPLPCHVEIAAWNPEKDLLAMVSADHQLTVHRFNWQKLWSITPDKTVTSICWRPDGKALAVGHEDGEISLHDVENGEIVRKIEIHSGSIRCLHWIEEKSILTQDGVLLHEGRTSRFFPQAPKPPPMPGTGSAFDMVASGENEEYTRQNEASKPSQQSLNTLCSADSNGVICLNAFGMFPIGELKLDDFSHEFRHKQLSPLKVMVSNDLCSLILLCGLDKKVEQTISISMDTTLLNSRRKEIRQVALEASSVEELLEVFQTTLTVMKKHWMDSISPFTEKFTAFQALLREHGSQSTPREELLSLLACGSASASLHQFLAVSLGEEGLKKLAKSIDGAGKKLHMLIAEHLQPCAEIVAFRIGELLGLSRWRSQLQSIGVEETLVNNVMESAGMLLVQVERFLHIVSQTLGQFRLFFLWLTKSLRQLNGEPAFPQEQSTSLNSAAIAFLKSQFECDPIGPHITSEGVLPSTVLTEEQLKAEELLLLGGFKDVNFLQRTLFQQFNSLRASWKEAFSKPVKVISPKLSFQSYIYLCDSPSKLSSTFYELNKGFIDYTCFQMHEKGTEYIGVVSGFSPQDEEYTQVVALQLASDLTCVDFALYKEKQLVLLLSRKVLEGGNAWIMVLKLEGLPFTTLRTSSTDLLQLCISNDAVSIIDVTSGKVRLVPQDVIPPLAVSASRGLACVFAAQRRALLYDLEEDEEEKDTEAN